jgi:hypothetical protein
MSMLGKNLRLNGLGDRKMPKMELEKNITIKGKLDKNYLYITIIANGKEKVQAAYPLTTLLGGATNESSESETESAEDN